MKNLVKLLPLVAAMTLVSCKKDQTADQLIVEENVEATAAPEASASAPEAVAVASAAGPATTVALSESNFSFGFYIVSGFHDFIAGINNSFRIF